MLVQNRSIFPTPPLDVELTNGVLSEKHKYYQLSAGGDPADYEDYTDEVTIPSFENKYEAKGYISVKAKKVLDGRGLNAGEFGFKLVREGTDAPPIS